MPSFRNLRGEPVEETVTSREGVPKPPASVTEASDVAVARERARKLRAEREERPEGRSRLVASEGEIRVERRGRDFLAGLSMELVTEDQQPLETARTALQEAMAAVQRCEAALGELEARFARVPTMEATMKALEAVLKPTTKEET